MYEETLEIAENSANSMEKLRIINSLIEIFEELQNSPKVLSFSKEAIKIAEKFGDLKKFVNILLEH
ncbi:MAG: hypothetical protein ACFFC3_01295 [Candidatus Odinarchaeota archaeon]